MTERIKFALIRMWLWAALIFCLTTVSPAQSRYRTEVFGSVGVSDYLVIQGPPIRAVNLGGGLGLRPFSGDRSPFLRMLGLEFESNATRASTMQGTTTQSYFTGNLLFHASVGHAEPYLLLGGGASHERDTHRAGNVGRMSDSLLKFDDSPKTFSRRF